MQARSSATAVKGILTASLVLLCLVAEVGTVAHVMIVRHAVCPEHGEIVHASHGDTPASDGALLSSPAARSIPAHHGADSHDHCGVACSRTSFCPPREGARAIPNGDATTAARPPRALDARPTIALILVAPKGSPPV